MKNNPRSDYEVFTGRVISTITILLLIGMFGAIIGSAIPHAAKAKPLEDREISRSYTESQIGYIQDRRTGFCFAIHTHDEYSSWGSQVPCTEEVKKLLRDSL